MVTDSAHVTHLVLTRLVRSLKLLTALPTAEHIVSSRWLIDSAQAGHFVPITAAYEWNDPLFRETFGCDIQCTIRSPIRQSLFTGKTFYMTPSVNPKYKDLQRLIELCGGKVERQRRSMARIADGQAQDPDAYIILSCTKDLHLLADLLRGKTNRIICASEFVLTSIMTQTIDIEKHIIKYF